MRRSVWKLWWISCTIGDTIFKAKTICVFSLVDMWKDNKYYIIAEWITLVMVSLPQVEKRGIFVAMVQCHV